MLAVPLEVANANSARSAVRFDDVYRQNFDFVWRVLRGMGVSESEIEDATQDVFIVVLRRLDEFDGRAAVRTWLFQIALRVASNWRRGTRRKGDRVPMDEQTPSTALGPDATAESRRALATVLSILEGLDEDLRLVWVLIELEQMTGAEVAELTGVNANTVGSRVRRAREAFRVALQRQNRSLG